MNNLIVKINYINKRDIVEKILTVTIHSSLAIGYHYTLTPILAPYNYQP